MSEAMRAVVHHARAHDGVITRKEALALGMTARTLDHRIEEEVLVKVATSVYALPGVFESEASLLGAATRSLGAVVSHQAAARLHGVVVPGPRLVVSVPHRRTHLFSEVVVHQLTDIRDVDVSQVGGLPTTTPARTMVDLAAVLSRPALGRALDRFVVARRVGFVEVSDLLDELARKGKPGVVKLRGVLEPRLESRDRSESDLETRLLELMRQAGLPEPESQHRPPWLKHVNGRVRSCVPGVCARDRG